MVHRETRNVTADSDRAYGILAADPALARAVLH